MPEEMKEGSTFNPDLSSESKFQPGPSEEELKKFQGPEARKDPPDIRMEGKEGDEGTEPSDEEAIRRMYEERYAFGRGATGRLIRAIEEKKVDKLIEKKELLPLYQESGIDLLNDVTHWIEDARTHFQPDQYDLKFHRRPVAFAQKELMQTGIKVRSELDKHPEISGLGKTLNSDLVRFEAFHTLAEHSSGLFRFYYDGHKAYMLLVTGARLKVLSADDLRKIAGPLKTPELTETERQKLPEGLVDGLGERLRRAISEQLYFKMAIGSMNRFDPYLESGREMEMKIDGTTKEFLASLFKIEDETKPERNTRKATVNGKDFYINLLSYSTTLRNEEERKVYESTLRALVIENAHSVLKGFPEEISLFSPEQDARYKKLLTDVRQTARKIRENWDNLFTPDMKWLESSWAQELGFALDIGSFMINDYAYRYSWDEEGEGADFKVEIGGPNTAFDTINAWLFLVHELQYRQKGRVVSPLLPPADEKSIDKIIRRIVSDRDRDLAKKTLTGGSTGLRVGAAILGLYPGEINLTPADTKKVEKIRGKKTFNPDALKALEKTLWIFESAVGGGRPLPMPIKPAMESANLFGALIDPKTKKTARDELLEGRLLSEIDFERYDPFAPDSWEVNNKMHNDVFDMLYSRQDPKYLDTYFDNPFTGLGDIIKKIDISRRAENYTIDGERVPRPFFEITEAAWVIVSHLVLVEHGIWDGHGNWRGFEQDNFWEGSKEKPGLKQWLEAASYLPKNKLGFEHYSDSMVLLMRAVAEWYAELATTADKEWKEVDTGLENTLAK